MKLYKHQEDALERTKNFNKVAFYHDMGLFQLLGVIMNLRGLLEILD